MICNKCKDTRHATKDCKLDHCAVCGKRNYITDDCTWLKQMKLVPKFVGYAARGLGVLLVQSSKDNVELENPNPMAPVTVKSGMLNETQLLEGLNYMFNWNWQWRCKKQGSSAFLMRFLNKGRLMELINYDDFTLLGTGAVINIKKWAFDSQAVGKSHTVSVTFDKVPDCFRHFFGMCEVVASLGPVLEIDMDTITHERIRAKVGVRDFEKIPGYTEITDRDLNIYRVMPTLEKVVEMAWYGDHKRQHLEEAGMDCVGDELRKRQKNTNNSGDTNREAINLGILSLVQFEEIKKRSDAVLLTQQEQIKEREARKKVEADMAAVMKRMQENEEEKARQKALRVQEEKRIGEMEKERKSLMDLVHKQQNIIDRCVEKVER
ncbi:hypothetical protein CFC21_049139 [Triticum aestivum]|uniref:DUF4283 domain-containing protein n=2 Tax=Triticum aestivum TaxID=4565 RepID=A0A9R1G1B8_WHEAT|nr:hypothetical protein CFC21_049139 [Triticum aestivum]